MDLYSVQQKIEASMEWFDKNHKELAISKANYEQKRDYQKSQLAICELQVHAGTQAERTRMALSHKDYIDFLQELHLARLNFLKRNCEYEAKEGKLSALRSLNKHLA